MAHGQPHQVSPVRSTAAIPVSVLAVRIPRSAIGVALKTSIRARARDGNPASGYMRPFPLWTSWNTRVNYGKS